LGGVERKYELAAQRSTRRCSKQMQFTQQKSHPAGRVADLLESAMTGRKSPIGIKFIAPLYTPKTRDASEIFMKFTVIVVAL
jgi:hypothetical protein